jgi:hypothetical protein
MQRSSAGDLKAASSTSQDVGLAPAQSGRCEIHDQAMTVTTLSEARAMHPRSPVSYAAAAS